MKIIRQSMMLMLLIAAQVSFSQPTDSLRWTREDLSKATVLLWEKSTNKSGTATIVVNDGKYFFLTANHVAKQITKQGEVYLNNDNKPLIYRLSDVVQETTEWKHHKTADMAYIEFTACDDILQDFISKWSFPASGIYTGEQALPMDVEVFFLGFPTIDFKLEYFSPLLFLAHPCSGLITQRRYDNNNLTTFFFLDQPSTQGCSGSGVFFGIGQNNGFVYGKRTLLVGLVHGTKGDNTGGKLAAITPTFYIKDL